MRNADKIIKIAELSTKLGLLDQKIKVAKPSEVTILEVQMAALREAITLASREMFQEWRM